MGSCGIPSPPRGASIVCPEAQPSHAAFALDMRQAFPNETGFSDTNVKYMKRWYLFYYKQVIKGHQVGDQFEDIEKGQQVAGQIKGFEKSQQVVDQLETANRQQAVDEKGQQVVGQLQFPDTFGLIPWGCHILIISKCQSLDEALFYIDRVVEEGWSRSRLEAQVAANLFGSQVQPSPTSSIHYLLRRANWPKNC